MRLVAEGESGAYLNVCEHFALKPDAKRAKLDTFYFLIAATPGNTLPSIYSSKAPPPVET